MAVSFKLIGQSGHNVDVTPNGELIVSPIRPDSVVFKELGEPNTAYNFFPPIQGKGILLTGITAKADKQVSSTVDATVIIYAATSDTSTTPEVIIYQDVMVEGDRIQLTDLNLLIAEGYYINAKTTDDDIHMNIFCRYV